jgi:hypothetical protein
MVQRHPRRRSAARLLLYAVAITIITSPIMSLWGMAAARSGRICAWSDPTLVSSERNAANELWLTNVNQSLGSVLPSKAYSGVWLRDSFWTLTALGDPRPSSLALRRFAHSQRASGQIPTQFETFVTHPLYFPDESTSLFLIWSAWQLERGGQTPPMRSLYHALGYVRSQARGGRFISAAGSYHSWFDSFNLPRPDTLSYNQGLYVDALQAARVLGLGISEHEIAAAIGGYQSLAQRPGVYLPFSAQLALHDISGLAGDFISLWLFKRPLLSDSTVAATLGTQTKFFSGYRVVTDRHGHYLSVHAFVVRVQPGDYQNGGSWLLFDYLALATGYLHHVPGTGSALRQRLKLEFEQSPTFHEYLNTNPQAGIYKSEAPIRDGFSWDTFVSAIDAVVLADCVQ